MIRTGSGQTLEDLSMAPGLKRLYHPCLGAFPPLRIRLFAADLTQWLAFFDIDRSVVRSPHCSLRPRVEKPPPE